MAYTIEEEQELNQLKEWWKDNGKTIIAAFILGVGGMLGWRYWQSYQANQIMQASAEYDALVYTTNKDAAAQQAKVAPDLSARLNCFLKLPPLQCNMMLKCGNSERSFSASWNEANVVPSP